MVLLSSLVAGSGTAPNYENHGTVNFGDPPQIDAVAFANYGTFNVQSRLPFDFQNTLYFTNRGTMSSSVGFKFDTVGDDGLRRPAHNFMNFGGSDVRGIEGYGYYGYSNLYFPTHLFISATNVLNAGHMAVGNSGTLRVAGHNVDMTRGSLEVYPLLSFGWANSIYDVDRNNIPDSFDPDNAIYDNWWGTGIQDPPINGPIYTPSIIRSYGGGFLGTSPYHWVTNKFAWGQVRIQAYAPATYNTTFAYTGVVFGAYTTVQLTNFDGSYSNVSVPTNIIRQAVVVGLNDTNILVRTRFSSMRSRTAFNTVAVEISMVTTNIITAQREVNAVYFVDLLASQTNLISLTNLSVWPPPTARPIAFEVSRDSSFDFQSGVNGNTELFKNIVYDPSFSNTIATNFYAGYSCSIDFLEANSPAVQDASRTNLPGRIEIGADVLDLTKTRIRGMGSVNIAAKHLKGSAGAQVDVPNVTCDFSSTNGLLSIQSLTQESVDRLNGGILAWSGVWTNQTAVILSNWGVDANSNFVFSPVNVPVDVDIHCLILDASTMTKIQPMVLHSLAGRSTNVVIDDTVLVGGTLLFEADNFTLNGKLLFRGAAVDWTYATAPTLRNFTNNGTLSVQNIANLGGDYPDGHRWKQFVNKGTMDAAGYRIASDYYEDSGTTTAAYDLTVVAGTAKLYGGRDDSRGDLHLFAEDMRLKNHVLVAARSLFLAVTNSLLDLGITAANHITVGDGFHLVVKPTSGNLLGTTFETSAAQFRSVIHTWAAEDRGATREGFADNAAMGTLTLHVFPGAELRFGPPNDDAGQPLPGNYGLYTDYLDLRDALQTDPESAMVIEPGLTIYFAASNVPVEDLDGKFGGRLKWVQDFAGPRSGVDVALRDGRTIRMNAALVDSKLIDSDGDGLANAYDPFPFDGVTITDVKVTSLAPFETLLSWQAAAQTSYRVEFATNLVSPINWQPLATVFNDGITGRVLSVSDIVMLTNVINPTNIVVTNLTPAGGAERYYRVRNDF